MYRQAKVALRQTGFTIGLGGGSRTKVSACRCYRLNKSVWPAVRDAERSEAV